MIQPGNTKLGHVPNFSLPAETTCPGRTELCVKHCYARKGHFRQFNVRLAHANNYDLSLKSYFAKNMIAEIAQLGISVLRMHVGGDFYSAPYIRKWIKIAKACPSTTFFAYTHSWTVPRLVRALVEFGELPNVQLWWSCDADTHETNGPPPDCSDEIRVAYLQVADDEHIPKYADLVFRVNRETVRTRINNVRICPAETGKLPKAHCAECKLCWANC